MIRALTVWLIRHTCALCGKASWRTGMHVACDRELFGADA